MKKQTIALSGIIVLSIIIGFFIGTSYKSRELTGAENKKLKKEVENSIEELEKDVKDSIQENQKSIEEFSEEEREVAEEKDKESEKDDEEKKGEDEKGFIEEFSKDEELYYVGQRNPKVENEYGMTTKEIAEQFTKEELEEYSEDMACTDESIGWFEELEKGDKFQKFYTASYGRDDDYLTIEESIGKYFPAEYLDKVKEKDDYSRGVEIEDYWVKVDPEIELSEEYIENNIDYGRYDEPAEEIKGEGIEIILGNNSCSGHHVTEGFKIERCEGSTAAKFKDGIFQGKTFKKDCEPIGFDGAKIKNTKEDINNFLEKLNL